MRKIIILQGTKFQRTKISTTQLISNLNCMLDHQDRQPHFTIFHLIRLLAKKKKKKGPCKQIMQMTKNMATMPLP